MTRFERQIEKARDDHAAAEVAFNKAKARLDACAAIVKAYEAHPDAPNACLGTEPEQIAVGRKIVVLDESEWLDGERE